MPRLDAIDVGDSVKVILRSVPASRKYEAERMWLRVTGVDNVRILGALDNAPYDIPQLSLGDEIVVHRHHIIDTLWKDPEKEKTLPREESKQVWERCLVDREVLQGVARVGYVYREEPDMTLEDDEYPDSGWRIRAEVDQLTQEQYENPKPQYIAIGKVLNKDDSWIHLLASPIGSKYLRNSATGDF